MENFKVCLNFPVKSFCVCQPDLALWVYAIDGSYNNLSLSSNDVPFDQRHLQFLVTDKFKSISKINPKFMWSFFGPKKLSYNWKKGTVLNLPRTRSPYYGTNAIHFRGSLIWNNVPAKVKFRNSNLKFWKILIVNVSFARKLVLWQYLTCCQCNSIYFCVGIY